MLTQERLRELLHYAPATGVFTWLKPPKFSSSVAAGAVAGYIHSSGYVRISVIGKEYVAHRLAWFYMTGEWPQDMLDHKNTVEHDNRWDNLRPANNMLNQQNKKGCMAFNRTGLIGVTRNTSKFFQATIFVNRKKVHLGTYRTPEEAHAAYIAAKRELHPFFVESNLPAVNATS